MSVAKFGQAELAFAPTIVTMLDPVREERLAQYVRQFCDDALRRCGTEAALAEAAVIVRSVLADAAHGLHGALYVDAFLSALPDVIGRLRSLRIEFIMIDPEIDRLADALSAPAPCLEQLTVHALSNAWGVMNGRDISPPFCAPRLRSVSITGVAFSTSLNPLPSVSHVTLDLGSRASRMSWAKHLFALFPNAVEVSLPDFGGALDFPSTPAASHVIQSLKIGHEGANNPQSFLPMHWHLARIAFISLRWASQKTARELLTETFPGPATPRVLYITGFGTRIALSDAAGAVRRECDLMAKDFARLLADPGLFATVTDLTLVDRCTPDPAWKLVAALPALTQLTILVAQ